MHNQYRLGWLNTTAFAEEMNISVYVQLKIFFCLTFFHQFLCALTYTNCLITKIIYSLIVIKKDADKVAINNACIKLYVKMFSLSFRLCFVLFFKQNENGCFYSCG